MGSEAYFEAACGGVWRRAWYAWRNGVVLEVHNPGTMSQRSILVCLRGIAASIVQDAVLISMRFGAWGGADKPRDSQTVGATHMVPTPNSKTSETVKRIRLFATEPRLGERQIG